MSPDRPDLGQHFRRMIAAGGPIPVAAYMAEANAHYYAARDPLGAGGDFVTAPEISQMFGELVGLWLADLWARAGAPADALYVELGPGRGTLAADALRSMRSAGLRPPAHFVETSLVLRRAQAERVPAAHWHDTIDTLPQGAPLLIVANEFFDALPVRQLVATEQGWHERLVGLSGDRLTPMAGPRLSPMLVPEHVRAAPPGTILETSPASVAIAEELAHRIERSGGAALILDYGHARTTVGETLQAVSNHQFADPWEGPGACDLTAHVDFEALAGGALRSGVRVHGPAEQGAWLEQMGIAVRAAALTRAQPGRSAEIEMAYRRLVAPDQMGSLFKTMSFTASSWPIPAAFQ